MDIKITIRLLIFAIFVLSILNIIQTKQQGKVNSSLVRSQMIQFEIMEGIYSHIESVCHISPVIKHPE